MGVLCARPNRSSLMLLVVPLAMTLPGRLKRFKYIDAAAPEKVHRFCSFSHFGRFWYTELDTLQGWERLR